VISTAPSRRKTVQMLTAQGKRQNGSDKIPRNIEQIGLCAKK
jgi:hypothetical protein